MSLRAAIAAGRRNEQRQLRAKTRLTPSQAKLLASLSDGQKRSVNRRKERAVERLAELGLIKAELIVLPDCKRGSALFWQVEAMGAK